jgi:hypothetical protein
MDAAGLRTRIQATLDANAEVRRQAEQELKAVCDESSLGAGLCGHGGSGDKIAHRHSD